MDLTRSHIFHRAAKAMRKLADAASDHLGSDCFIHAALVQKMLETVGIETVLVVGHAAWRVGNGDSDVIMHVPAPGAAMHGVGLPYHAWLEFPGHWLIYDTTVYQIRAKAAALDESDGGRTTVDWCPDYLLVNKNTVSPLKRVVQKRSGLYYYARHAPTERIILGQAPELDPADVTSALMLFNNPEMVVLGPNHTTDGEQK